MRRRGQVALTPEIERAARDGAWFVGNISGGKDGGGAMAAANDWLDSVGHPRERRSLIWANLGRAEWVSSPAQVSAQAAALDLPLSVVTRGAGDLVTRFERRWELGVEAYLDLRLYHLRGPWSSPSLKFCQSEMKAQVMGPHLARLHRGEQIIQVVGIRREESRKRANTPIYKPDYRDAALGNRHGTTMALWHPAVLWTTDEVFEVNHRYGVPLAESYTAYGSTRHSCALCIMQSRPDQEASMRCADNHWLLRHYVGMEVGSGFSFQADRWLGDLAPEVIGSELYGRVQDAKRWADERRQIEAGLPAKHLFQRGWPLFQPTMDEAVVIAAARAQIIDHHGWERSYCTAVQVYDRFAELLALKPAEKS